MIGPPIAYGAASLGGWGVADWLVVSPIQRLGAARTLFLTQLVGLVIVVPIAVGAGTWSAEGTLLAVAAGAMNAAGYMFFYAGLRSGLVAVVSPLSAAWAAVTALLSVVWLNEKLSLTQCIAIGVVLLGSSMSGLGRTANQLRAEMESGEASRAAAYAVCAAISWGVGFTLFAASSRSMGWAGPVAVVKFVIVVITAAMVWHSGFRLNVRPMWRRLSVAGLFDTGAFLTYSVGASARAAVVAPVAAGYPAVTAALALVIGKERLSPHQYVGIAFVVVGLCGLKLAAD